MTLIVGYPDTVLRRACLAVVCFDAELVRLVEQMKEAMYSSAGIGLAAPQVGKGDRIVVIDPSGGEATNRMTVMINPEVTWRSAEQRLGEEGCLSLLGVKLQVPRAQAIDVEYHDLTGQRQTQWCEGLEARIVQHEVDHLDGVLMIDRVSSLARNLAMKGLRENG